MWIGVGMVVLCAESSLCDDDSGFGSPRGPLLQQSASVFQRDRASFSGLDIVPICMLHGVCGCASIERSYIISRRFVSGQHIMVCFTSTALQLRLPLPKLKLVCKGEQVVMSQS